MTRSVPQIISLVAIVAGLVLFVVTMLGIDRTETLIEARSLGAALPLVLLPGIGWHCCARRLVCLLPSRESPLVLARVSRPLAADGVGYFTIRGVASEPLRVVLLMNRVSPVVSAAASVPRTHRDGNHERGRRRRLRGVAVSSDMLPETWQGVFRGIAITAARRPVPVVPVPERHRPLLRADGRTDLCAHAVADGPGGRTVRAISAVEDLFFKLAAHRRAPAAASRAVQHPVLWMMALEVFLVFWAIGEPISLWVGTIVETFTRSASVPGGAIPGNLGALEASNVAVAKALGLVGGGTLALFRRFRSLLFATMGLALYPRDAVIAPPSPPTPAP
jgi:hypothetical protein